MLAAVTRKTKVVFLANPNNPTGTYIPFDEVKRLHQGLPPHVLLVLDAAYAEYVQRNDYESGIELVATSDNVVMCRTFSKIHGLAALRLGWMYGPAHVIDAINRIRGPFNVNAPAIAAGIAAIEDTAHQERSREHNARWLAWLTEEIGKLGLKVTPSVANFVLIHFPETKGRTAKDADAFLTARGLMLRQVAAYKLPHALRMSVGTEEANKLVVAALSGVSGEAGVSDKPLFNRLALIGVGLIGGSIARAARAQGVVRNDRCDVALRANAASASPSSASPTKWSTTDGCGGRRRRSGHRLRSGRRLRRGRAGDRPASASPARSSPTSARSRARCCATWRPTFPPACISFPATRSPAPKIPGRMRASPNCSSTAGASSRRRRTTDKAAVERLAAFWRALGANVEIMSAEHHDLVLAVTSHLPHLIAYNIVGTADELAPVTQLRSAEILRRRLSRLHPHRRVRSDHVARRLPAQQGRGAGNARPLQRGSGDLDARDPLRRRRDVVQSVHPHPRHPPRHEPTQFKCARAGFSASQMPNHGPSRCCGPTPATTSNASVAAASLFCVDHDDRRNGRAEQRSGKRGHPHHRDQTIHRDGPSSSGAAQVAIFHRDCGAGCFW